MAFAQDELCLSPYRKLLLELSSELSTNDLEKLKFASIDVIPRGMTENVSSGFKLFDILEQDGRITPRNLSLLEDMLRTVGRMDLAWKVKLFSTSLLNGDSDFDVKSGYADDEVHDGVGTNNDSQQNGFAVPGNRSDTPPNKGGAAEKSIVEYDEEVPDGVADESERDRVVMPKKQRRSINSMSGVRREALRQVNQGLLYRAPADNLSFKDGSQNGTKAEARTIQQFSDGNEGTSLARGPAPSTSFAVETCSQAQTRQHAGRLQKDPSVEPAPVRYVNFLAYQDYSVEIIGGKHFKTPDGEFVEIKSGTQYQIHVKNSRDYGCNLDISIDGYDVGGWVVDGGQELTIQRSAYEAKKFTFYRVKTAPKEAGIEPGRAENGIVKCVFTPEALLNIPVIIPGLPHPLEVNIHPSATVGDLKREVQSQSNASPDLDQVLVLDDKVISNYTRLSYVLKASPGNLRLIDVELEITVEASSSAIFPVKIHPGRAKVRDLMDQIERELDVPIKDQKLYHGEARLSDAPKRGLPQELICSLKPTVFVLVPEYIDVAIEDLSSGEECIVKIDKGKTLHELLKEIPSCSALHENEVTFFFNGQKLRSSKGTPQTLRSLGICSGSKLDLKREEKRDEKVIPSTPEDNKEKKTPSFLQRIRARFFDQKEPDEETQRPGGISPLTRLSAYEEIQPHCGRKIPGYKKCVASVPDRPQAQGRVLTENDPAWKAGGTTLQGYSTQQFIPADPIKVDHSRKVELVLRLVAREDETDLEFPKDEFKPLSTLLPPPVQE